MTQQERTLIALPEDSGSVPTIHMAAAFNSSSREPGALFWPLYAPGMHTVQGVHMAQTPIHIR